MKNGSMTDDTRHFTSIPWVSTLLTDKNYITTPAPSRLFKSTTEDSFYSTTLNTPGTISHCLAQYRRPPQDAVPYQPGAIPTSEIRIFCTLGSDLNGYPGILHGGMVSSLLDECMGLVLSFRLGGGMPGQEGPVTAYLSTKFKGPVRTPGVVVVSGWIVEMKENRKWLLKGNIRDHEGRILAEAECLYVLPRGVGGKI
ncbi:PaaI family thioesterase [Aspergillus undulatus]|uniref:PaaI family thioesterase n=1 Tax=Aspergillus undulatus TaxID=1810928 RepID=UPI003CCCA660